MPQVDGLAGELPPGSLATRPPWRRPCRGPVPRRRRARTSRRPRGSRPGAPPVGAQPNQRWTRASSRGRPSVAAMAGSTTCTVASLAKCSSRSIWTSSLERKWAKTSALRHADPFGHLAESDAGQAVPAHQLESLLEDPLAGGRGFVSHADKIARPVVWRLVSCRTIVFFLDTLCRDDARNQSRSPPVRVTAHHSCRTLSCKVHSGPGPTDSGQSTPDRWKERYDLFQRVVHIVR